MDPVCYFFLIILGLFRFILFRSLLPLSLSIPISIDERTQFAGYSLPSNEETRRRRRRRRRTVQHVEWRRKS